MDFAQGSIAFCFPRKSDRNPLNLDRIDLNGGGGVVVSFSLRESGRGLLNLERIDFRGDFVADFPLKRQAAVR